MNNYDDVQLGQDYQDSVTGFVGTATAKAEYLHTSASVRLEALVDKKPVSEWFDISRIQTSE